MKCFMGFRKQQKPAEQRENILKASKELMPAPLSHSAIIPYESRGAENKKMAEKKSTNENGDDNVIIVSHTLELEEPTEREHNIRDWQ